MLNCMKEYEVENDMPQIFLSSEGRDLLNTVFQYDPDDRPTAEEIFNEPWMTLPINEKIFNCMKYRCNWR